MLEEQHLSKILNVATQKVAAIAPIQGLQVSPLDGAIERIDFAENATEEERNAAAEWAANYQPPPLPDIAGFVSTILGTVELLLDTVASISPTRMQSLFARWQSPQPGETSEQLIERFNAGTQIWNTTIEDDRFTSAIAAVLNEDRLFELDDAIARYNIPWERNGLKLEPV